ncbi:hypothetical protein D3C86_1179360 [compost metagenome]
MDVEILDVGVFADVDEVGGVFDVLVGGGFQHQDWFHLVNARVELDERALIRIRRDVLTKEIAVHIAFPHLTHSTLFVAFGVSVRRADADVRQVLIRDLNDLNHRATVKVFHGQCPLRTLTTQFSGTGVTQGSKARD